MIMREAIFRSTCENRTFLPDFKPVERSVRGGLGFLAGNPALPLRLELLFSLLSVSKTRRMELGPTEARLPEGTEGGGTALPGLLELRSAISSAANPANACVCCKTLQTRAYVCKELQKQSVCLRRNCNQKSRFAPKLTKRNRLQFQNWLCTMARRDIPKMLVT